MKGRRRSRRISAAATVAILAIATLLQIAPVQAIQLDIPIFAEFREDTYAYHGEEGHWTDPDFSGIPCPPQDGETNYVLVYIHAAMNEADTNYPAMGYVEGKTNNSGSCASSHFQTYKWEWFSPSDHNSGEMPYWNAPGTHTFTLEKRTTGCASGSSFCWHFEINGDSDPQHSHTCCAASWADGANKVEVYFECHKWDSQYGVDCPASGLADPVNNLTYKKASDDIWYPWAGKDSECVDYSRKARGDWNSATSVTGGFNTGTLGSQFSNCPV